MVPRRQQKARAAELRGRSDQSHEIGIRFTDGMGEHTNASGVATNSTEVLDERRGLLLNQVAQFDLAVIAVYLMADAVAGWHIDGRGRANLIARECLPQRRAP